MKIRITTAPPLPATYKLTIGSVHDAIPNSRWQKGAPRWFVDGKGKYTADGIGIFEGEAEEVTEEPDYETEENQGTEVPVLQTADDGRMVASTGRSDPVMDVPMLSAQPADEDRNRHL